MNKGNIAMADGGDDSNPLSCVQLNTSDQVGRKEDDKLTEMFAEQLANLLLNYCQYKRVSGMKKRREQCGRYDWV
jgi:hypothetical protein